MSYWYHPDIEKKTIGAIMDYFHNNPDALCRMLFTNGEEYICDYIGSYESDNSGDFDYDIQDDDPNYDEFYEVVLRIVKVINSGIGRLHTGDLLAINYRDFPTLITNADTGEIIYPTPKTQETTE